MGSKYRFPSYIIMAVIMFFAVNIIGTLALTKYDIDLTEGGLYTVSSGSRTILGNLEEPITLRFFFSNEAANGIPVLKSYAARIRGLLEDYVKYSNGKITLRIVDPEPFSDEEELALSFGMKGVGIDSEGTKVYLGMAATNSVDQTQAIPLFALEREKFLEYEVTRAIFDLGNPKRKKIGILSSVKMGAGPMLGIPALGGGPDWLIIEQMKKVFNIEDIGGGAVKIPSDIDVLMIVQPKGLDNEALYAIDQYVLGGGRVVVFADPNKEGGGTGNPSDRSFSSGFKRLFRAWGVDVAQNLVVADRIAARKYNKDSNPKETWKSVDYLAWLNLHGDNINRDDLTTSLLGTINMNTAGVVNDLGVVDVKVVPLIKSNKESTTISVNKVRTSRNPAKILREFKADENEYVLAARITGNVRSAFSENSDRAGHLSKSLEEVHIVVVADMDILRDENWAKTQKYDGHIVATTISDNSAFVINVLDHLSGSSELMGLRGRGSLRRPFVKVENLRRDAEARYLKKEEDLKDELAQTERRLSELQSMAQEQTHNSLLYKREQQIEIKKFSAEMRKNKKELRNVQGELRKDIDRLGSVLKFINIWLMPLFIAVLAMFIFVAKKADMNRRYKG